jgi:alkanesulfonate monooxygenase SsuD/methylene tetrahydromethanopterin reductase-like flavin-dependent oxidoreductase (luciferase family)
MEFGIFDHLDGYDLPLRDYYEARLQLIELYDRAGFYAYHLAEHHSTPLGMAPSPSVFLSAIAQRTRRLRFGPLVFALPLYHPLRIIEEICMLDHLSGGRLEIGFGRGSSPVELGFYGQDPKTAQAVYAEMLELVLRGLTEPVLTFHGERYHFDKVPMELSPLQKPHPPVWYGVHSPEAADRAARKRLHTVSLDNAADAKLSTDRYRAVWRELNGDAPLPKMGLGRFIVVAETDTEALELARRAYPRWHASFTHLQKTHDWTAQHPRPADFDSLTVNGQGIAGAPDRVILALRTQLGQTGTNYVVGQFAFGDLTLEECQKSVGLFASHVIPALRNGVSS